jgi:hypothetical protein
MDTNFDIGLGQYEISFKKYQSQLTSSPTLSRVIKFNFIVNFVIYVCLEDFHNTTAPPSVKTYPLVDFKYLVSNI